MMKISCRLLSLLLTLAAAPVSSSLNSDGNSYSYSNGNSVIRGLFEEGPPSLTIFGELDEDIFCRCEAHNCYFNPSPYAVEDLKIVFDTFTSTSVVSSKCTDGSDDSIGCLQFNQTATGTGTLLRDFVDMTYVNRASASCACPEGSVLSAAVVNGKAVKGANVQTGVVVQSLDTSGVTVRSNYANPTDDLLVNYPGVGYCVDNSLEDALMPRPTSILPDTAKTSIQIQTTNREQLPIGTHRRLAVAACCREGEFDQEHGGCSATPMVNVPDVLTFSIEAFESEWLDRQDSPYPCVLVTAVNNNAQRMCLGGGGNGHDELCVEGDAVLVCRPPTTTADESVGTNMEIGCPNSDYLLVYNGYIEDNGLLTKGYQMRSPQGYQNALVPNLGCIQGNLQYSRFDHEACIAQSNQMNITYNNGDPPPPPAKRINPVTGDLELIDASGNVIAKNLPNGRDKPGVDSENPGMDGEESSAPLVLLTSSVLVLVVALVAVPIVW